jgi:hypothetical protein
MRGVNKTVKFKDCVTHNDEKRGKTEEPDEKKRQKQLQCSTVLQITPVHSARHTQDNWLTFVSEAKGSIFILMRIVVRIKYIYLIHMPNLSCF